MKKTCIYIALCALLAACDNMERSERLIYEKPAPARRAVLLEDFTGQRCVNCPKATEVIELLEQEYGDSVLIAVGIHGGPLGFMGNATTVGLATDVGTEYYEHWNLEYQPVGLVDRGQPVSYPEWAAAVKQELDKPAPLTLSVEAGINGEGAVSISVRATGTDGITTGKLQVWLLEDGITALQLMPDGSVNRDYVHHHVLRTPVNGTWGEDITIREGEETTRTFSQAISSDWKKENLSVVAFVWNDKGVQQAAKAHVR